MGPAVRGRRETPGCLHSFLWPEQQGHPFVCHLTEGLATRVSVQTLALTCRVALSSDVAARQGRAEGAEGEPSRSSQET